MEYQFFTDTENFLRSKFEKYPAESVLVLDACPAGMTGDFTLNCFKIGRFCDNPVKAAVLVAEFLKEHPDIENVEVIKAFVNVTVKAEALYRDSVASVGRLLDSAVLPKTQQKRILIEFSAPNTNKPQHLGHVRNNTLGMSLASLLERVGHDVIKINLVNDRGIHICKSMIAYQRFGNSCTPESTGIKGDHLVGNYYVEFNRALAKEIKELKASRPELENKDDAELFLDTELGQSTQKMLQDWEAGNPDVRTLWETMNSWVFKGFAQTYERMGIKFDHTYLESETYLLGKDIIASGLEKGVFAKREDGAVICDLGKLGKKVVLRSDGTSVYITQDIGTTLKKYEDYHPESMVWVVGDEQNLHFQILFEIMQRLGYPWANQLYHLSYGMVNLPTGKMKSREGTVVDADDLFDEMVTLATAACKERCSEEIETAELLERSEIIGIGALKFMLLKFNPRTTIMFDPASSLKFEGDTGPYIQYAAARINSIKRKAIERGIDFSSAKVNWSLLTHPAEKNLAVIAGFYPSVLKLAAERFDCSGLAEYLLNLAKAFNRFYRECPVLSAESSELISSRLALADAIRSIIVDGLSTLTIKVPQAM